MMQQAPAIAAAITAVALIARIASDVRHNRRIARKWRVAEAAALAKLEVENTQSAQSPQQQEAAFQAVQAAPRKKRNVWTFASLFLASLFLLLSGLPPLQTGLDRGHQLSALAATLSLIAALISIFALHKEKAALQEQPVASIEEEPKQHAPRHNLTGTWIKDKQASDSMAAAIELARLNRLVRAAVTMIKGIQIAQTEHCFEMAVFSVVPWFKVRELYPMTGELCRQRRRDLRKGYHTGRAVVTAAGLMRLEFQWPDPVGGSGYDEFRLAAEDELHVDSRIEVGETVVAYTTVYRRR